MQLKQLFAEEDAVSPVIGVILMVAITVILAAVIGTFVLGLGENVQSAPQATLQVQESSTTSAFDLRHRGGDQLDFNELDIVVEGSSNGNDGTYVYGGSTSYSTDGGDDVISAGQTDEITLGTTGGDEEQVTVTLVHTPSDNIILERDVTIDFGT